MTVEMIDLVPMHPHERGWNDYFKGIGYRENNPYPNDSIDAINYILGHTDARDDEHPDRHAAYNTGYDAGLRGDPYDNPYNSVDLNHDMFSPGMYDAYARGHSDGQWDKDHADRNTLDDAI